MCSQFMSLTNDRYGYMTIYIKDNKVVFKEDLVARIKLIGEHVVRDLVKILTSLEVLHLYKISSSRRVTNKCKKKMK